MSSPIEALPLPEICYQDAGQQYWIPDKKGKWIRITETSAKRYLKEKGYSADESEGPTIDKALLDIQQQKNVAYAGKLAGFTAGFHEINGNNILVTDSPRHLVPKPGEWPLINQILEGMLNVEPVDQRPYFYGWLKRSLESFQSGRWMPGQVIAFAGPRQSAKSLLQGLITEMFGGRSAKPYLFFSGRTNFNYDLFQAEHLMIEDEAELVDIKSRRHFGAALKQLAVNNSHQCHGKNKDGLTLTPIWRATISLNDDPERLLVLPPITDDIEDKIMLFKVGRKPMPMPTRTLAEMNAFRQALSAELPAFVDFLLKYEIPEAIRCDRCGVRHYHHPEVLSALEETSPEVRLLNLIDKEIFKSSLFGVAVAEEMEFSALDLELRLKGDSSAVKREAEKLFYYPTACGTYLGRLAKASGSRVSKRTLHGDNLWTIQPPPQSTLNTPTGCSPCNSPNRAELGGGVDPFLKLNDKKINNEEDTPTGDCANGVRVENSIHPSTQTTNTLCLQSNVRKEDGELVLA